MLSVGTSSLSARRIVPLLLALVVAGGVLWNNVRNQPIRSRIEAGQSYWQNGQLAAAQSQWQEAVRLDPHNAQAWGLLGEAGLQMRDFNAALAAFEQARRAGSDDASLDGQAAFCAFQLQKFTAARGFAQAALKRDPKSVKVLELLAGIEKSDNHPDAQLSALQQLVELQPDQGAPLLRLGRELSQRQNYDLLLPVAQRLVKIEPQATTSYFLRGAALWNTSSTPQSDARAEADFQKSAQLDPMGVEAHRALAQLYARQNQPRRAIAQFHIIEKLHPYASSHLFELSRAYRSAGQTPLAEQTEARFVHLKEVNRQMISIQQRIDLFPRDPNPSLQMGALLLACVQGQDADWQLLRYRFLHGNLKSVGSYAIRAARLRPGAPETLARQVEAALQKQLRAANAGLDKGDLPGAKNAMARALVLLPDDARTRQTLARFSSLNLDPLGTLPPPSPNDTRDE